MNFTNTTTKWTDESPALKNQVDIFTNDSSRIGELSESVREELAEHI